MKENIKYSFVVIGGAVCLVIAASAMRFLEKYFYLGPTASFVGAAIVGLIGFFCALCTLNPTLRQSLRWGKGGVGGPVSAVGAASFSFAAFTWSVILVDLGLNSGSLSGVLQWMLIVANVGLLIAAVSDAIRNRKTSGNPLAGPQAETDG